MLKTSAIALIGATMTFVSGDKLLACNGSACGAMPASASAQAPMADMPEMGNAPTCAAPAQAAAIPSQRQATATQTPGWRSGYRSYSYEPSYAPAYQAPAYRSYNPGPANIFRADRKIRGAY